MGVIGAMGAALFAVTWFDLPRFSAMLGPVAPTPLAAATLRADSGGFFAVWAVGALVAAWRNDRHYALMPLLLLAFACAGRALTFALTHDVAIVQPMAVEAALSTIILVARTQLAGARAS